MSNTCLLIKTKDNRQYLTHEKNLPSLVEFAKTFRAEIYKATPLTGQKVLELKQLITSICATDYESPAAEIAVRIFPNASERRKKLSTAKKIKGYIESQLITGQAVSLATLKERYADTGVSVASLCNHMSVVRSKLRSSGYKIDKLGAGIYKVKS